MAHHETFREELGTKYPTYGHAIWEPDPGGQYDAVEVGDVGFIREGYFLRLFNVLLPADHPSQNLGVPDSYEQLHPSVPNHIRRGRIRVGDRDRPNDFCSKHVTLVSRGAEYNASGPDDDAQVTFSCSGKQGALLSLPVPAQSEDTIARGEFGKWIVKYIHQWFAFAENLGLGVENMEEIILVTGRHHARSWINVAFSERQRDAGASFEVHVSHDRAINLEQRYVRGGELKLGPSGAFENLPENQCIFIRGLRVVRFLNLFPRLRGRAVFAPDSDPKSDGGSRPIGLLSDNNYQDPLRVLLRYIAERAPDCDMALVHDDDLARIAGALQGSFHPSGLIDHLRGFMPEVQRVLCDTLHVDESGSGTDVALAIAQVATLSKDIFRTMRRSQSISNFITIFGLALRQYKTLTGQDLQRHLYAIVFDNCDSHGDALDFFRRKTQALKYLHGGDEIDHESLIRLITSAIHDLSSFSATLGEGIGLIPLSPAKAIFAAIGVFLDVAKTMGAVHSYSMLRNLFGRLRVFLKRLKMYMAIPRTTEISKLLGNLMAHLLSVLALSTQELRQKFIREDVGDTLQMFDRLTLGTPLLTEEQLELAQSAKNHMMSLSTSNKWGDAMNTLLLFDRLTLGTPLLKSKKLLRLTLRDDNIFAGILPTRRQLPTREDLWEWLCPPDPSINHKAACAEGTATWFTQCRMFFPWRFCGSLLWVSGNSGSGKSVLCSTAIEAVKKLRQTLVAYYYFDARDTAKRDFRGFLSSVLAQLCEESDNYWGILSRLYMTHHDGSEVPSESSLARCLRSILELQEIPVYIFIDGLDECLADTTKISPREKVLGFVEDLVESRLSKLFLFITARPEEDIVDVLDPLIPTSQRMFLHEESRHREEILKYIRSFVHRDPLMLSWRSEDKELAIKVLSERSGGIFRWAACQLDFLRRSIPQDIRRALHELPASLDGTYERILQGIPQEKELHTHHLFQCLIAAARPLHIEELSVIQPDSGLDPELEEKWQPKEIQDLVPSACLSLITSYSVNGSRVILFSHSSVMEYLISPRITTPVVGKTLHYPMSLEHAHSILAKACLVSLLRLCEPVDKSLPLASYAAEHLIGHLRFGGVALEMQSLLELLFDPTMPHFSSWIRFHNIDTGRNRYVDGQGRRAPQPEAMPLYYASLCGFPKIADKLIVTHAEGVDAEGGSHGFPLRAALARGHFDVARLLLMRGADVNKKDKDNKTVLGVAADTGDLEAVQLLLDHGTDTNALDNKYQTPLHLAASNGHLEVVRSLLSHGANTHARDHLKRTPLQLAVSMGHFTVARLLIVHGADTNDVATVPSIVALGDGRLQIARLLLWDVADEEGSDDVDGNRTALLLTPRSRDVELAWLRLDQRMGANADVVGHTPSTLLVASTNGSIDMTRLILQHAVDANTRDVVASTLLLEASRRGQIDVAQLLLQHGADANTCNSVGGTPLVEASRNGNINMARLLLQYGATVNAGDGTSNAPLFVASRNDRFAVVKLLLEYGADMEARNSFGRTPLLEALWNRSLDVIRLLLTHGADANARDSFGNTASLIASKHRSASSVQLLVIHGADVNVGNNFGTTPLLEASTDEDDSVEVAKLLLESGVDVNARDCGGSTPLLEASRNERDLIITLLLNHGADVTVGDNLGETPLLEISRIGNDMVARQLLSHGADVNATNYCGRTPLDEAYRNGHDRVAQLLLKHGANTNATDDFNETPLLKKQSTEVEVALQHGVGERGSEKKRKGLVKGGGDTSRLKFLSKHDNDVEYMYPEFSSS